MNIKKKSGFTLLEIIIVIIIVGVLASLALPRFFRTIEFSRTTEAFSGIQALRGSLERCYLSKGFNYSGCTNVSNLDVENPGLSPNAHFTYSVDNVGTNYATGYRIVATRNTLDGTNNGDQVLLTQTATTVTRSGTGLYVGIQ